MSFMNIWAAIDSVTLLIIVVIGGIFFASLISILRHSHNSANYVKQMQAFGYQLAKDNQIAINELAEVPRAWAVDTLVVSQQAGQQIAEKTSEGYVTRVPLAHAMIAEPLVHSKSTPALLTSLGVSGTFLGITLGLAGFEMTDVGLDSSSLINSAVVLLDGMKTAFYTSLAGLLGSAILMIVMQLIAKYQRGIVAKTNRLLHQQLVEVSAVSYLKQLVELNAEKDNNDAQQQTAETMLSLSNNLSGFMEQLQGVTQSLNGQGMAERISTSVGQAMKESVVPVLSEFKNELAVFREIKEENQQQLLSSLIGTIKQELITPVTEELSKTTAAVTVSTQVSEKLNENVAKVLSEVARTVETIDSFNQSTMQQLQEFAQQLRAVLTGFKDDTQHTMQAITTKVEDVLNISIQGMEAQRAAFDGSAERATLAFEGMGDKLEEALNQRTQSERSLFGEMENRLQTLLQNTSDSFERQTDILEKTGQEAGKLMQSAREDLKSGLSEVLQGFKDETQGTMQAITAKVEEVLSNTIQGMEAQRAAFDGSAERATLAFEGMGDKLEEALNQRAQSESALFGEMEARIQALLYSTSASFDRQTDILEKTGQEAGQLMQSAREELERGLGDIDTKVLSMSQTVQRELESFRTQYQENMTNFFNDQNNLLEDTLGKQRNNLVEVVDKFKQVFEEEYQTRHNLLKELTAQHEHLQKSAHTIQQLAKAIGLTETATMSQLQDVAQTIGRHVGDLKKEYIQASSAFKEVTEGLPKAMEEYFKHANQSTELFFQNFDQASSKIHNRLAQAADFLVDARLQDMTYDKAAVV